MQHKKQSFKRKERLLSNYQAIYNALKPLNLPVASVVFPVDGSDSLPDTFLVVGFVASTNEIYYSGKHQYNNARYDITIYSREGARVEVLAQQIKDCFLDISQYINESNDLFHQETSHYSRTIDFRFYKHKGD